MPNGPTLFAHPFVYPFRPPRCLRAAAGETSKMEMMLF